MSPLTVKSAQSAQLGNYKNTFKSKIIPYEPPEIIQTDLELITDLFVLDIYSILPDDRFPGYWFCCTQVCCLFDVAGTDASKAARSIRPEYKVLGKNRYNHAKWFINESAMFQLMAKSKDPNIVELWRDVLGSFLRNEKAVMQVVPKA